MSEPLPLSLVVITRNEAAHIGRCLDSVPFAAEKFVLDSGSDDDTVAIARAHGARVEHQDWLGFGAQRNAAAARARHDWQLVLDADETLSPELAAELQAWLPEVMASAAAVGILRRRTLYMGRPMRWYRPMVGERLARLYHRERARWREVRVHESLEWQGRAVQFAAAFDHAHNPTLVHKGLKVLRYAELKALDGRARRRAARPWLWPMVFLGAFLKDYLLRLAVLDGARGYAVAQTAASYAVYKRMRLYEMQLNPASVAEAREVLVRHGLEH